MQSITILQTNRTTSYEYAYLCAYFVLRIATVDIAAYCSIWQLERPEHNNESKHLVLPCAKFGMDISFRTCKCASDRKRNITNKFTQKQPMFTSFNSLMYINFQDNRRFRCLSHQFTKAEQVKRILVLWLGQRSQHFNVMIVYLILCHPDQHWS